MSGSPSVDQIAKRNPFESVDERGEAPLTSVEVDAMAKPIAGLDPGHAGLPRIDLPRMNVKGVRHTRPQDPAHAPEPQQIGGEPEVTAPAPRDPVLAKPEARDTDLIETIAEQNDRSARIHPPQVAIAIMRDGRHDGRIVVKTHILQDRDCPFGDGETGRAVAADPLAGQVFEALL